MLTEYQLGNWKIEFPGICPTAGGTPGIGVDQRHVMAAGFKFAGDADRQSGLADATFELTDGDDPVSFTA